MLFIVCCVVIVKGKKSSTQYNGYIVKLKEKQKKRIQDLHKKSNPEEKFDQIKFEMNEKLTQMKSELDKLKQENRGKRKTLKIFTSTPNPIKEKIILPPPKMSVEEMTSQLKKTEKAIEKIRIELDKLSINISPF